ncbi:MAG: hypothetical protein DRI44_00270 [Chlamydiae bacterium]|nr:MAG: hypothetical protein DRI44_00270 [Chlamydiota bacterium]
MISKYYQILLLIFLLFAPVSFAERVTEEFKNELKVLYNKGKFNEGRNIIQKKLDAAIQKTGTNDAYIADLYDQMAMSYYYNGKYEEELPYYYKTLNIRKTIYTNAHIEIADTYYGLGNVYRLIGEYDKSEHFHNHGIKTIEQAVGRINLCTANHLNNKALLYHIQSKYAEAEKLYKEAFDIYKQILNTNAYRLTVSMNNLASLYRSIGNYEAAEPLLKRALKMRIALIGEKTHDTCKIKTKIAGIYSKQKKYKKAEKIYLENIDFYNSLPYPSEGKNFNLRNIANLYFLQKKYLLAKKYGEMAYKSALEFHSLNHIATMSAIVLLGDINFKLEKYDVAEREYNKALKISKLLFGKSNPNTANIIGKLASVCVKQTNYVKAVKLFVSSTKILELSTVTAGGEDFSKSLRKQQQKSCSDFLECELLLLKNTIDLADVYAEKTFWITEISRSRKLLQQIYNATATKRCNLTSKDKKRERRLIVKKQSLEKRMRNEIAKPKQLKDNNLIADIELQLSDVRSKLNNLKTEFDNKYPRYSELRKPKPITVSQVQNKILKNNEVLVNYWIGNEHLFAIVIGKTNFYFLAHKISSERLNNLIANFRHTLEFHGALSKLSDFKSASFNLYSQILQPFAEKITNDNPKTIFIVPHGNLAAIPFSALISNTNGTSFSTLNYMLNNVKFAYIPSATVLRAVKKNERLNINYHLSTRASARRSRSNTQSVVMLETNCQSSEKRFPALLVGDPIYTKEQAIKSKISIFLNKTSYKIANALVSFDITHNRIATRSLQFGSNGDISLKPLPATKKEVEYISRIFYGNNNKQFIYIQNRASESILKSLNNNSGLNKYKYIHFAVHGILPGQIKGFAEPCLVLSIYGDKENDGFLKMSEIFNLNLNADIIVLSACQSGLVECGDDESISGLARAFFYAGARNVVASLWSIDDKGTNELMKQFYENLNKKQSPVKSLFNAKIQLKSSKQFCHPFFWSSFILNGNAE